MKKGFTLIELLAVLAIIAIVATITAPIILNVIRTSKEKAFIDTAGSLVTSAINYQVDSGDISAFTVDFKAKTNINKLEIEGDLPDSGKLKIDEKGKVTLAVWSDNLKICVIKEKNSKEITKIEKSKSECTI